MLLLVASCYMDESRSSSPLWPFFLLCNNFKELSGKVLSNYMCTFVPYKMMSFSNVLNVREVAITPTRMDAVTRPVKIQTTANNLAHTPTGTLSPYLTNRRKHPTINLKTAIISKVTSTTYLASRCQIPTIIAKLLMN